MKKANITALILTLALTSFAAADLVTIADIQKTDAPSGDSPLNLQTVDCQGGIVVFKRAAKKPRLVLIDPNNKDAWGGIQVKGWKSDAFDDVNLGDWVQLEDVLVEENVGTTFLQYSAPFMKTPSVMNILSQDNPLPRPVVVDVNQIAGPIYDPAEDAWLTPEKTAEAYESMIVQVRNIAVVELGLGAKNDNYALQAINRTDDPNTVLAECWVADYLNQDGIKGIPYMPQVVLNETYCAVTGMLEQYTRLEDGYDLYQLLTLSNDSFIGLNPADLDQDCDVDLWDSNLMIEALMGTPVYGTDYNDDGKVDSADLDLYNQSWQDADLNKDGIVDGDDLDLM